MKALKLNELPLPITKALGDRSVFTDALFIRPDSLSALLPYDEYLEKDKLYLLKDGSLGVVYEATLLEHEPMTSKQIVDAVDELKPFFSLPENCTLQFLYDQAFVSSFDSQISSIGDTYPESHPVSQVLHKERMDLLKSSCANQSEQTPLRRRLYLAIRYFPKIIKQKKVKDYLDRGEITLYREMKEFIF